MNAVMPAVCPVERKVGVWGEFACFLFEGLHVGKPEAEKNEKNCTVNSCFSTYLSEEISGRTCFSSRCTQSPGDW
jgi:hypothetical protein